MGQILNEYFKQIEKYTTMPENYVISKAMIKDVKYQERFKNIRYRWLKTVSLESIKDLSFINICNLQAGEHYALQFALRPIRKGMKLRGRRSKIVCLFKIEFLDSGTTIKKVTLNKNMMFSL